MTPKHFLGTVAALLLAAAAAPLAAQELPEPPPTAAPATPVIPLPARVEPGEGRFVFAADTRIVARGGAEAEQVARDLAGRIGRLRGFTPKVDSGRRASERNAVVLALDPAASLGREAYELEVTPQGATVTARAPAGLFYGAVTLWQLATADGGQGPATIAAQRIEDAPRFAWRGLMLDVARHFRSVDEVKALIDQMALHKFNTLHWHLTDDQGWRIEIKRYPNLTAVGGCRIPAGAAGRDRNDAPRPYCGYYTQDEIREVVAYAAARHITVVPEIDLPGHAQAAIASYPSLGVTGATPPVSPDWGVHTWLFNVDDSTFEFLENVLAEVIDLFPSPYIHLGGDEAAKDQWQQSPAVQARRRELGLADDMQLQGWFMGRLARYLDSHGRRMVGWDEILEGGGLPADATVMSWRGTKGAIDAARAGHDVVLAPAPDMYFDHVQSDGADETPGRLDVITLQSVYRFEPVPAEIGPEEQRHVLGAQANLWTEHLRTNSRVQRAAFPRAAALAEATWTPAARRDWDGFLQRLVPMLARYRAQEFDAADSAFAVRFAATPLPNDRAWLALSSQAGFGTIRYTTDGSNPTPDSPAYTQQLELAWPAEVVATTFVGAQALAAPRHFAVDAHSLRARASSQLRSCKGGLTLRMEDDAPYDGPRALATADVFDPCWVYEQAALDGMTTLAVRVGQLPFNFQLWRDARQVVTRPETVPGGALEVRLDGCSGDPIVRLPLRLARVSDEMTTLEAPLPALRGRHDLCFVFASGAHDPMWVIDEVALLP